MWNILAKIVGFGIMLYININFNVMIEPKLLLKANVYPQDILITTVPESNRKIDPDIESRVDSTWRETYAKAREEGKLIFNGKAFRLEEYAFNEGKLNLTVSKIEYKYRSSLKKFIDQLMAKGEEYLPHTISVGGFIKTSDGKFIFGIRGTKTIASSIQDFIGGILESEMLTGGEDLIEADFREMREEANISKNDVEDIKVIAIVRTQGGNIIIVTSSVLKIDSNKVLEKFESKEKDSYEELTGLEMVEKINLDKKLNELGGYKTKLVELISEL